MLKEMAIIGPAEIVKPFIAAGLNCYETQDVKKAGLWLEELARQENIGIIFIAETLAQSLMEQIEKIKTQSLPAVFIMPEYGSNLRLGLKRLENTMSRALGKKISS
jgi:V/A-type H+/Na+-transporting ATPase subunit F